uniref:MFS domain-containing protein n=1 Tax=Haemonchus contortus TaxID=6289 RepID=A0A7I4YIM0_HAECO|nr:Major facilitator superfamily MFS-1 domain containing protein [Haemonchus contortus]
MGFNVPILNRDSDAVRAATKQWVEQPQNQKKLVLVIVSVALLLDNMLYMVIVPIIPKYLRDIHAYSVEFYGYHNETERLPNGTVIVRAVGAKIDYKDEEMELGWLFASKALIQIFVNPFSGYIIDRIGYELPMVIGLVTMFSSTAIFALGHSYTVMFFARSLQGFGSAFADTSGLAMIADRFNEENERSAALGIALAFISFGCLVAPPFGSVLYSLAGKPVPFLILSFVCLADALAVFMVIQPGRRAAVNAAGERIKGTPMWRLFMDPMIAICSGALIMANVSLAFLEPTITNWMAESMPDTPVWLVGVIWLPAFFPHVLGVYVTVKLLKAFPNHTWAIASVGLAMEGISCFAVPYTTSVMQLIIPLSFVCFGIALIDTSLLPMLGYLVDTRHVPVYGSVYAIADISYSLAYAFGPIIAGWIVGNMSFFALNIIIFVLNVGYTPVIFMLKKVHGYDSLTPKPEITALKNDNYGKIENDNNATEMTAAQTYQTPSYGTQGPNYQNSFPQPEYPAGFDPLNPQW